MTAAEKAVANLYKRACKLFKDQPSPGARLTLQSAMDAYALHFSESTMTPELAWEVAKNRVEELEGIRQAQQRPKRVR